MVANAVRLNRVINTNATRDCAHFHIPSVKGIVDADTDRGVHDQGTAAISGLSDGLPDLMSATQHQSSLRPRVMALMAGGGGTGTSTGATDGSLSRNHSPPKGRTNTNTNTNTNANTNANANGGRSGSPTLNNYTTATNANNMCNVTGVDNAVVGESSEIFSTFGDIGGCDSDIQSNYMSRPGPSRNGGFSSAGGKILVPRLGPRHKSSRFAHVNRRLITHNVLDDHHSGDPQSDLILIEAGNIGNNGDGGCRPVNTKQSILDKTRSLLPTNNNPAAGIVAIDGRSLASIDSGSTLIPSGGGGGGDEKGGGANALSALEPTETVGKTVVTCSVMLKTQISVLIGACSDKYFRFWAVPSTYTLCSCRYTDALGGTSTGTSTGAGTGTGAGAGSNVKGGARSDEIELCSNIVVTSTEDMLIAGFDNGKVRIWKIILQSLISLQNNHIQSQVASAAAVDGLMSGLSKLKSAVKKGVAISPLTFLCEWCAHDSSIVNIQVFNYQETDAEVFVADKAKQQNLSFNSLTSKKKVIVVNDEDDDDDDDDERQHRLMRAEIQRGLSDAMATGTGTGTGGTGSNIDTDFNSRTSGSNNFSDPINVNPQVTTATDTSVKKRVTQGQRISNSSVRNSILKHYNSNTLCYNDDITTLMPTMDGFLITSGKDQVVYLWSIIGELVGRVGGTSWNIMDTKTWGHGMLFDLFDYLICLLLVMFCLLFLYVLFNIIILSYREIYLT